MVREEKKEDLLELVTHWQEDRSSSALGICCLLVHHNP